MDTSRNPERIFESVNPEPGPNAPDRNDVLASSIRDYLNSLEQSESSAEETSNEHLALQEIAEIATRESDPERLQSLCLRKTATLLDLDVVRLYHVDGRTGDAELVVAHEDPRARIPRGDVSASIASFRRQQGKSHAAVSIEEVLDARRMKHPENRSYTLLSAPIAFQRQLWGILQAAVCSPRRLSASATRTIETIGALIGCGVARLEGIEREAAARGMIEKRNSRIIELNRKLRDVRNDLEHKNHSLQETMENLRRMETFKDAFLSSISHEMRTPLTIIRSYIDLLIHYAPESQEKANEFLHVIDAETTKLTLHINKILDLTEIHANEVQIHVGVNSVEDVVRSAIELISPFYEERNIKLEQRLQSGLPHLLVDRERTIQILVDLLDNAAKFSSENSVVTLAAQATPGNQAAAPQVTFWVEDHGVGVEADQQAKLFEQFFQIIETARGKPRGIGLGLPICKAYVEQMGGKLWLESEAGRGSTFFLTLPGTLEQIAP